MTNLINHNEEIWKDIPGHAGYQASTLGQIRSTGNNTQKKILRPFYKSNGYLRVEIRSKCYTVHSLILTTFIGERPKGFVSMHLNDKKDDNRPENLKWGTQSENALCAIKNKLYVHGRLGRRPVRQPDGRYKWILPG